MRQRAAHLQRFGKPDRGADLCDGRRDQVVDPRLERIGEPVQRPGALGGRERRPRTRVGGLPRRGDGGVGLGDRRGRDPGDLLLSGRIEHRDRRTLADNARSTDQKALGHDWSSALRRDRAHAGSPRV
jgi:hypothetical protein